MSFKESVFADNKNVFLNTEEFAELHSVIYDGETYRDVPIVLTKVKESKRTVLVGDNMRGIFLVSAVAHVALEDIGGVFPEQGKRIRIDDGEAVGVTFYKTYRIVTSDVEMGMVTLELEAFDE